MTAKLSIAVYGEVDMNLVDGSSVWMQRVVELFAGLPGARLTFVLRVPERRDLLLAPLRQLSNVTLVDPSPDGRSRPLTPKSALGHLLDLDNDQRFDLVLLRGGAVEQEVARTTALNGRVWIYHVPQGNHAEQLRRWRLLARAGGPVLCQTDAIRQAGSELVPELRPRLLLLPPMVPSAAFADHPPNSRPERLLYAGKLSPEYGAQEMLRLLRRVRDRHPDSTLDVFGDKVHSVPDDPGFRGSVERALAETPGVAWHGAVAQERLVEELGRGGVALSLRGSELDDSLELSTKVLEYGAAGLPIVLNPVRRHRDLLGDDYPLFAEDGDDALGVIEELRRDPELARTAGLRCLEASRAYSSDRLAELVASYVDRERPRSRSAVRVGIAGHQLAFAHDLLDELQRVGASVIRDRWRTHGRHDPEASAATADWADVILCEWCLGNAVFYSERLREDQKLVVRFHRSELDTEFPARLVLERVHRIVFVADHVRDEAIRKFDWPEHLLDVVPNSIRSERFDQPKLPRSEFNLALIGFVPSVKRLDRALDILESIRTKDRRYRLLVKGAGPQDYQWIRGREHELNYFSEVAERIDESPLLRDAVIFETHGPDVPEFLRKARFIVSTSNVEGHSVALAEGMAAGCVPVVLDRPGARKQYDERWVHTVPEDAAKSIVTGVTQGTAAADGERAKAWARRWDLQTSLPIWRDLLGV